MPICNPQDLPEKIDKRQCLLGLDLGTKTIGLAVSDPEFMVASPISTIKRKKYSLDIIELEKIMRERNVGALILGLPVNMDGTEGPRCQATRTFASNLMRETELFQKELDIAFWDERLSSATVNRFLINEADMTRKRRADVVDKMAAGYILQGALDAIRIHKYNQDNQS